MTGYAVVFLGAGFGGALRHGVNTLAARLLSTAFPFGTLLVNVVGSLLMGLLAGWFAQRADPGPVWRLFLATGVLGGFTTFSSFSLDLAALHGRGQTGTAALYAALSLFVSVGALFAGLALVRALGRAAGP